MKPGSILPRCASSAGHSTLINRKGFKPLGKPKSRAPRGACGYRVRTVGASGEKMPEFWGARDEGARDEGARGSWIPGGNGFPVVGNEAAGLDHAGLDHAGLLSEDLASLDFAIWVEMIGAG